MTSWLITGGSGFLGRALATRLLGKGVGRVLIYSRGEFAQAEARALVHDPGERCRWLIGDVRDLARLRWAMKDVDVVVHAAALKRIEVGAYAPTEMVKTNVDGAENVIDAAAYNRVKCVVAVSTDKAWQPISPYGQTKALAESLFLAADIERRGPRYAVVRYGNVWCSTGSIVPKWRALVAQGRRNVPVTDPDCTRFFMYGTQAVDLIMDTVKSGQRNELAIPRGLPAYRVGDLATAMDVEMDVQGLPAHEKKHEGLNHLWTSDLAKRMSVDQLRRLLNES